MIRNKTIKFNMDKPEDRELWEQLSALPHGSFSDGTKAHWRKMFSDALYRFTEDVASGKIKWVVGSNKEKESE